MFTKFMNRLYSFNDYLENKYNRFIDHPRIYYIWVHHEKQYWVPGDTLPSKHYFGIQEAYSFDEACELFFKRNDGKENFNLNWFDKEAMTYLGMHLYSGNPPGKINAK